jgi:outer membrane protein assembly factor BamB/class 3 adenylate cyclase
MSGPSRTRGFLFADLRGYTDFVERRGDHAAAELLDRYRLLVRETIGGFGGAEIKTEGDSFFVVLDSASSAVQCGLALTAAAAAETAEDPDHPIAVGVGVHAGETVETADGYVGSAVNIAARVCAQAPAGEVVVTETVRLLTRTFLEVDFAALGKRPLKGVPEPVPLFRVVARGSDARSIAPMRGFARLALRNTLVNRRVAIAVVVGLIAAGGGIAFVSLNSGRPAASPAPGGSTAAAATAIPTVLPDLKDVPTYKADATRRGLQPGPGPVATPVVAWSRQIGRNVSGSPMVGGGLVLIAGDDHLAAYDARTGDLRWTFKVNDTKLDETPAASTQDGLAFIADLKGTFHAIDMTCGTERWKVEGKKLNSMTRPIVVDGLVYMGADDGWAYGLEAATGTVRWSWHAPAPVTDITVSGGTAFVNVQDGYLYSIGLADQRERWHAPQTASTDNRAGIPMIEGETIYFGTGGGGGLVYAIDLATGTQVGQWRSPSDTQTSSAAERDGVVYVASKDDGLFALQGPTLQEMWHADAPAVVTGVELVGDVLYLAGNDGRLLAYRASDGTELWETPIAPLTENTSPAVTGGMLFQADANGVLRAYIEPALKALLPTGAPSSAPTASASTPLDGTYVTSFTRDELVASPLLTDAGEINDANWGKLTLMFSGGLVTSTLENDVTHGSACGTYAIRGDAVALSFTEGDSAGETFGFRWTLKEGTLTFRRDESLGVGPTPYLIKPWTKVVPPS